MAIDINGLSEGHLVAAAAAVLAEQPGQGPAKSSLTQQDASAFQNGREYESSAQHPGAQSREEVLSDDGRHAPQQNGVALGKAASDVSMLSRSNSQGGDEDDGEAGSLIGRKRSSSKLNPPKEEDRTLPLKKLFENLTGVSEANPVCTAPLAFRVLHLQSWRSFILHVLIPFGKPVCTHVCTSCMSMMVAFKKTSYAEKWSCGCRRKGAR